MTAHIVAIVNGSEVRAIEATFDPFATLARYRAEHGAGVLWTLGTCLATHAAARVTELVTQAANAGHTRAVGFVQKDVKEMG